MTTVGDSPFDPTDYAFTVAEAATVSQVSENDIRNWMRRGVVPVGTKSRLGRIMFSALDIVRLRVIGDLNKLLSVDPSAADPVANHVAEHCRAWMQRENVHLHQTPDGYRKETRLLLHLNPEGEGGALTPVEWGDTAFGFKVPERGSGQDWARRPMLILPVEQVFNDVLEELFQILEGESGDG
jgi:hypothetical protein